MDNSQKRAVAIVLKDYAEQAYQALTAVHNLTEIWVLDKTDFFLPSEATVRLAEDLYSRVSVKPLHITEYIRTLNLTTVTPPAGIVIPPEGIIIPTDGSFRF